MGRSVKSSDNLIAKQQASNQRKIKDLIIAKDEAEEALEEEFERTIEILFIQYLKDYHYQQYEHEFAQRQQKVALSNQQSNVNLTTILFYLFYFFSFKKTVLSKQYKLIEMDELKIARDDWEIPLNKLTEEETHKIKTQYLDIFSKRVDEKCWITELDEGKQIESLMKDTQIYQQIKKLENSYNQRILHNQNLINKKYSSLLYFHKSSQSKNESNQAKDNLSNEFISNFSQILK